MNLHTVIARTLLTGAMLGFSAIVAPAIVIPMTGGDAGEGYAPLNTVFAAVDLGGAGGQAIQGVAFTSSSPSITLSTVTVALDAFASEPFPSTTADDDALFRIGRNSVFNNPGPITLTISGLTIGVDYQIDSFVGLATSFLDRIESVTATGFTAVSDSREVTNGTLFNFSQTLQPNANGQIIMTYAATSGFTSPNINGISITSTTTPVPEPTAALFGMALAGFCGIARRRSRATA